MARGAEGGADAQGEEEEERVAGCRLASFPATAKKRGVDKARERGERQAAPFAEAPGLRHHRAAKTERATRNKRRKKKKKKRGRQRDEGEA
ncbi:Hypothetical predicted protein [Podarcis lilfordi]|uniref:Uncharacterized protein n=1 Tax=Podarcis lilfordi TaxID=74358 RepID=A0AA35PLN3_9SAUR|nr:Hypothetical predicted protein [Podarcis lilfordi]